MKAKFILYCTSLILLLAGCSQSPKGSQLGYEETLEQFRTDSLEILKARFDQFNYYDKAFESIAMTMPAEEHKEFSLLVENKYPKTDFNCLYINKSYYKDGYDHQYDLPVYYHLDNVERLIKGEELVFDSDGDFASSPSKLDEFRGFCHHFAKAEYILILEDTEIVLPQYMADGSNSYVPGSYKGKVVLFDFQEKKFLDNFEIEIFSSEDVTVETVAGQPQDDNRILLQDLFNNIRDKILAELKFRYTVEGGMPSQGTVKTF